MMSHIKILYIALLVLSTCCGTVWADDAITIPLHYGVNHVNFGDGGTVGMAVLGRRENFNAHGFDVLTLYLKPKNTKNDSEDWQLVSVFDGEKEGLTLTVGGGADCTLHDFRLVRDGVRDSFRLIVAERDVGSSYADSAPVHFKFYTLRRNNSAEVGRPLYYFELVKNSMAKISYCDVEDAFIKELGIRPYRQ
jgi:hypothetical protein